MLTPPEPMTGAERQQRCRELTAKLDELFRWVEPDQEDWDQVEAEHGTLGLTGMATYRHHRRLAQIAKLTRLVRGKSGKTRR
jgi:hypothetical protein